MNEKQWEEYLAKSERDVLWRALGNLRNAQASFAVTNQTDLRTECDNLAIRVEERLRTLYGTLSS